MTTYTAGLSDGQYWDAGGHTAITAHRLSTARRRAEQWADEGDYPCAPPVTVLIILKRGEQEVARWPHRVPDTACSGDAE